MKTTTILMAFVLAITLPACSEDPFFEVERPYPLPLKEQLQSDEDDCPYCRPAPGSFGPAVLEKEQLQDQDEVDWGCPGCEGLPPDGENPLVLLKEQLQNEPDRAPCEGCDP